MDVRAFPRVLCLMSVLCRIVGAGADGATSDPLVQLVVNGASARDSILSSKRFSVDYEILNVSSQDSRISTASLKPSPYFQEYGNIHLYARQGPQEFYFGSMIPDPAAETPTTSTDIIVFDGAQGLCMYKEFAANRPPPSRYSVTYQQEDPLAMASRVYILPYKMATALMCRKSFLTEALERAIRDYPGDVRVQEDPSTHVLHLQTKHGPNLRVQWRLNASDLYPIEVECFRNDKLLVRSESKGWKKHPGDFWFPSEIVLERYNFAGQLMRVLKLRVLSLRFDDNVPSSCILTSDVRSVELQHASAVWDYVYDLGYVVGVRPPSASGLSEQ